MRVSAGWQPKMGSFPPYGVAGPLARTLTSLGYLKSRVFTLI